MSGPWIGDDVYDGIAVRQRTDISLPIPGPLGPTPPFGPVNIPPRVRGDGGIAPPSYYTGPIPYFGDFEPQPRSNAAVGLFLEFSSPIKVFHITAAYVAQFGLVMNALKVVDGGFGANVAAQATWDPFTNGTRTVQSDVGFKGIVIYSGPPAAPGITIPVPTFNRAFFFVDLPTPEVVTPPEPNVALPRGAGRTIAISWPIFANFGANSLPNTGVVVRPRPVADVTGIDPASSGTVPTPEGATVFNGRKCFIVTSSSAGSRWYVPRAGAMPWQFFIQNTRPAKSDLTALDEIAVWRLRGLLAFDNPADLVPGDMGLVICPGLNQKVRNDTQAGISFGLRGVQTIGVAVRQTNGGPLTYDQALTLPDGFDVTAWNEYEMRLVSSNFDTDAELKFFINDELLLTLPWGDGTLLPDQRDGASPENFGYTWNIANRGGAGFVTRMYIPLGGIQIDAAMTEDALR